MADRASDSIADVRDIIATTSPVPLISLLILPKVRVVIISAWGEHLEQNTEGAVTVWDTQSLPYDKSLILGAICAHIIATPDEALVLKLVTGAFYLESYQDGVGLQPLSPFGDEAWKQLRSELSNVLEDRRGFVSRLSSDDAKVRRERSRSFEALRERDRAEILSKVLAAKKLRGDAHLATGRADQTH